MTRFWSRLSLPMLLWGSLVLVGCAPTLEANTPSARDLIDPAQTEGSLADLPLEELLRRGQDHLGKRHLGLAQLHFTRALKLDERSTTAINGLGATLFIQEKYQDATKVFSKALEIDPTDPVALVGLGKSERSLGNLAKAREYLAKAMETRPMDSEVLTELAICHDLMNRWDLAEAIYRQVINLEPASASAFNNLGFNLSMQGHYPEAIEHFNQALQLAPTMSVARNNLAAAYILNDQRDKGRRLFDSELGEAAAYNNIGYLMMLQQRWDEAEMALNKAIELNPVFYARARNNLDQLQEKRRQHLESLKQPATTATQPATTDRKE